MARAAFFQQIVNVTPVDDITINCQMRVVFVDTSPSGVGVTTDDFTFVNITTTDTTDNIEASVRDAISARGVAISGTDWSINDVYQFILRRA